MGRYNPVEFCGEIKKETEFAFLVYDGINEIWIPKSQLQDEPRRLSSQADDYEFIIPEWLAIEKGII